MSKIKECDTLLSSEKGEDLGSEVIFLIPAVPQAPKTPWALWGFPEFPKDAQHQGLGL